MMRVKITDVAKAAGVSVSTVSLVLNDAPSRISDETRSRVRQVAEDLGYRPSSAARGLRLRRTKTVGVISDVIASTPFAGRMIAGVQDAAREHGYLVFLADTNDDPQIEAAALQAYVDQQVDGMIYACMHHKVVEAPPSLLPGTVFLDCRPAAGGFAAVVPDDRLGGFTATQELTDVGHRRIAFVGAAEEPIPVASQLRFVGYRDALAAAGLEFDPLLQLEAEVSGQGGCEAVMTLLSLPPERRPTGVFFFNDRQAVGAYMAAHRLGFSIPQDLSVVGYDDQQFVAAEQDPPLTTVALPHYEMGRWAMEVALGHEVAPTSSHSHLMPCPLIRRASVGSPPAIAYQRRSTV